MTNPLFSCTLEGFVKIRRSPSAFTVVSTIKKPRLFTSILAMKCPSCRQHPVFRHANAYDLKKVGEMHPYCPVCGSSNRVEPGFYFGAAYVSYILMVGILIAMVFVYYLIFGEVFEHFWRLMISATLLSIGLTPLIFRYSRVIFLYICVPYKGVSGNEQKATRVK